VFYGYLHVFPFSSPHNVSSLAHLLLPAEDKSSLLYFKCLYEIHYNRVCYWGIRLPGRYLRKSLSTTVHRTKPIVVYRLEWSYF
jgi:hypothetical protein